MMRWEILLLLAAQFITVQCQTWTGTFIFNSGCDLTSCCCLSNNITVTNPSSNTLAFNTGLAGSLCGGQTSYSGQFNYPTGYTVTASISIITLTITLSSDSNTITITNSLGSSCGSVAVRESTAVSTTTTIATTDGSSAAAKEYVNILILLIMTFLSSFF